MDIRLCLCISINNKLINVFLLHTLFCFFLTTTLTFGAATDVYCLSTLKNSLQDPLNYLNSSWNFNNSTEGFICKFSGIDCHHPDENKVLNIRLFDMGLQGQFPKGLQNCTSMTGLDLSSNNLSGPIPPNICDILPFLTSLDLSSNSFSGEIPVNLSKCLFLNVLKLDNNQFMGQIPLQIGNLMRLKTFSVTNNLLSGQIPTFVYTAFPSESYTNNRGLCGRPLDPCKVSRKDGFTRMWFYIGIEGGCVVGFWGFCGVLLFKKNWRYAYFRFVNVIVDRLLYTIAKQKV